MPRPAIFLLLLVSCASVRSPEPQTAVDAFVAAMTNADAEALAAAFAEDATVFMPFDSVPRRLEGRDEIRKTFDRFFEGVRKSAPAPPYMTLEPHDLHVQRLGADAAVVTFHLGKTGGPLSRRTFVLERRNGVWVIAHLHASNMQPTSSPSSPS